VTVAAAAELSLEEKFQQGTGTNLELASFLDAAAVESVRACVGAVAEALGVEGYARIDGFWDRATAELVVLEANTLCGLTEATVLYTQMLGAAGLAPAELLERLVDLGLRRRGPRRAAPPDEGRAAARTNGEAPCSA
jgi:D-alanine-D-alanine ligase-like ATP-grasp enzyme